MEPISTKSRTGKSSPRWNPTKEQLDMLENLYAEGMRTPSAEQILSIARKLQAYGEIEGKNVFYWFQNHKARQRQKQKQKQKMNQFISVNSLSSNAATVTAYFNQLHFPSTLVSPPAAAPLGDSLPHNFNHNPYYNGDGCGCGKVRVTQKLFPEYPTGILQRRAARIGSRVGSEDGGICCDPDIIISLRGWL